MKIFRLVVNMGPENPTRMVGPFYETEEECRRVARSRVVQGLLKKHHIDAWMEEIETDGVGQTKEETRS